MTWSLAFAQDADIARIAQIWHAGWHDAHSDVVPSALTRLRTLDSFLERTRDKLPVTRVVKIDDEVQGFCMTQGDELYQIYVAPAARGSGAAQGLVADAEAEIAQNGHCLAWLACAQGNARAMRFYEKCGWRNAGAETVDLDTSEGAFPLTVWRYERAL